MQPFAQQIALHPPPPTPDLVGIVTQLPPDNLLDPEANPPAPLPTPPPTHVPLTSASATLVGSVLAKPPPDSEFGPT